MLDARTSQLPRGYLVEAIMHRRRSIASGVGADAVESRDQHASRMVDVNSERTAQDLIDLVEFLATQTPLHASLGSAP